MHTNAKPKSIQLRPRCQAPSRLRSTSRCMVHFSQVHVSPFADRLVADSRRTNPNAKTHRHSSKPRLDKKSGEQASSERLARKVNDQTSNPQSPALKGRPSSNKRPSELQPSRSIPSSPSPSKGKGLKLKRPWPSSVSVTFMFVVTFVCRSVPEFAPS